MKYQILLTNDDGFDSKGLLLLKEELERRGFSVLAVAPLVEMSGCSHAITMDRPLRIKRIDAHKNLWAVDGTPTDCLYLARAHLLKGEQPEFVVSGINDGANLAEDTTYSGTVAAAMEAAVWGVPSIAFSCIERNPKHWSEVAKLAADLTELFFLNRSWWQQGVFLNVNIPDRSELSLANVELTTQGRRMYGQDVRHVVDPRGKEYYWIGGSPRECTGQAGTDCHAVAKGKVSLTPMSIRWTCVEVKESVANVLTQAGQKRSESGRF